MREITEDITIDKYNLPKGTIVSVIKIFVFLIYKKLI
jgi:hypothetical protein